MSGKEECYILGNGPALNEALVHFKDKDKTDFFAVNLFALQEAFFNLKPSNYIVIDSGFWTIESVVDCANEKRKEEINNDVVKFWENMKKVDWDMNLFIPAQCPASIYKNISSSINIVRINTIPLSGWQAVKFALYNAALGMPLPQNVMNAAIYCAIFMRYKKIYLYGANHSWMLDLRVDEKNRIYTADQHFYKGSTERHFFPKGGLELHLRSYANAFASHSELEIYSRHCGVRVYNRTHGSFIDAYEFDIK